MGAAEKTKTKQDYFLSYRYQSYKDYHCQHFWWSYNKIRQTLDHQLVQTSALTPVQLHEFAVKPDLNVIIYLFHVSSLQGVPGLTYRAEQGVKCTTGD